MGYRTRTYIAADWSGDSDAVKQLHTWNNSERWSLSFTDAHDLMQARDSSLNCSIKISLCERMDRSKTFVLIVGDHTKTVTSGSCQHCKQYFLGKCLLNHSVSHNSYIEYECSKAVRDGLNIIVLYNAATVNKSKCPDMLKEKGLHIAMCTYKDGLYYWNYPAVKKALDSVDFAHA